MNKVLNLRNKMIFLSIVSMLSIFSLLQYQHSNSVSKTVRDADYSRNLLLIKTLLPIVRTNLAFGLLDANREYLDAIVEDNINIMKITLHAQDAQLLYAYKIVSNEDSDRLKSYEISQTISDKETQVLLGVIKIQFSDIYFSRVLSEDKNFMIKISIAFFIILFFMLWVLGRTFAPMHQLVKQINVFEPQKDNFELERTSLHDETGVMQNAIVDMIERIELYNRELIELNQTLEDKINIRTATLKEEVEKVKEQEKMLIAQSRLAAMGEMMSMIAHQWRQPLSTSTLMISNYKIEALLEGRESDKRDDILDSISDTMIYLSDTIDDFQTYFKPEKKRATCELYGVMQRAYSFSKARLDTYGVSLKIDCSKTLHVETYFNELVQIIINIINNAIDAIEQVQSPKKEIHIVCKNEHHKTIIQISDSGGGAAEDVLEHMFDPYFSTKGKNGTGLGLYMAKMIVHKHIEGEISVKNIEGGACFTIRL
ncbi:MAG: HAMP domain-containing sensor histidine kinase [Campylobacterota bacterium]|nr:HAMP domain-containing sensor histidine kinase [Campylobacterota bacterium]